MKKINDPTFNSTQSRIQSGICVVVEQYFGRLYQYCGVLYGTYRQDHIQADIDFQLGCLLTNLLMEFNDLQEIDHKLYKAMIKARVKKFEVDKSKKKAARERYARRMRAERVTNRLLNA